MASSRSNTHTATASNRRRMANWPVAGAGEKKYSPLEEEKHTHSHSRSMRRMASSWGRQVTTEAPKYARDTLGLIIFFV